MRKNSFQKNNNLLYKNNKGTHNIDVELSEELKNHDSIDIDSNYQDMDQIIDLTEKTLTKHYSNKRK